MSFAFLPFDPLKSYVITLGVESFGKVLANQGILYKLAVTLKVPFESSIL